MIFKSALASQGWPCSNKPLSIQTLRHPQFLSNFQSPKFKLSVSGKKNVHLFGIMTKTYLYCIGDQLRFIFEMLFYFFKGIIWSHLFFLLMDTKHQLIQTLGMGGSAVLWSIPLTTHAILNYLNILVYSFPILKKNLVMKTWEISMQTMPNG